MESQIWAVAVSAKESQDELYRGTDVSCKQDTFNLPIEKLRVGTMDSLMSLGDDLSKMDMLAEATAFKLFKQLDELKRDGSVTGGAKLDVNGVPIGAYVRTWEWDEAKFQMKTPLRELAESISQRISGLEDDLKTKMIEMSSLKSAIQQYERKGQGNLMVRALDDVVTEDDYLETEYMTTLLVVVPKHSYKEFSGTYMKMAEHVVPLTAKLIHEDAEFGLFTVVVFKKSVEKFRAAAREKRFMVRDYVFDEKKAEEGEKDKEEKVAEYSRLKGVMSHWCSINFAEAYGMMMHLKAIRVFVESCMRYGLTTSGGGARRPNFKAFLLQPKKGKTEVLRKDLAKLYSKPGSLLDGDDDMMVPGATGEFFPYVYVPISLDPLGSLA